jgi:hypothetical protein
MTWRGWINRSGTRADAEALESANRSRRPPVLQHSPTEATSAARRTYRRAKGAQPEPPKAPPAPAPGAASCLSAIKTARAAERRRRPQPMRNSCPEAGGLVAR